LFGCGGIPNTESVFIPYVLEFIKDTKVDKERPLNTSISFKSLEGATVGKCNPITNEIVIDPMYWFRVATKLEKRALIYHEMMHCVQFVSHKKGKLKDGCPRSIMNPILPGNRCIKKHEKSYIEDLRDLCK